MTSSVQPSPLQPGDIDPSTINEFQQAEMSRAVTPREKSIIIKLYKLATQKRKLYSTMRDVGELGKKALATKKRKLYSTMNDVGELGKKALATQKRKLYSTMKDVGELGKKAFIITCIVLIITAAVRYHHSCVEKLQEELQIANKCENINFVCS